MHVNPHSFPCYAKHGDTRNSLQLSVASPQGRHYLAHKKQDKDPTEICFEKLKVEACSQRMEIFAINFND